MEPENYTKENKNTLTNILLFLVLLVMVGILFFLVKNYKKSEVVHVPVEEVPVDIPAEIEPSSSTENSLLIMGSNNELVVGQEYPLLFNMSDSTLARYCGVKEYTPPYETARNYMIFSRGNSCIPGEMDTIGFSLTHFDVDLKSEFNLNVLNELNKRYGVVFAYPDRIGSWPTILSAVNTELNAYTLAKIYYDTGYFKWTAPGAGFSISSNNADF